MVDEDVRAEAKALADELDMIDDEIGDLLMQVANSQNELAAFRSALARKQRKRKKIESQIEHMKKETPELEPIFNQ